MASLVMNSFYLDRLPSLLRLMLLCPIDVAIILSTLNIIHIHITYQTLVLA